ncbi:uncharacterized protein LOC132196044 [Neocloeon triangulifer]|uniref:uncharacterized protein LOC132196044 n=1 Tax=Neocloeon triangulifer TaxID=2078957 RepID=UPI00286F432D|nr:uncharacterized protein LOC132196044 [Neocloeon triangulifer]
MTRSVFAMTITITLPCNKEYGNSFGFVEVFDVANENFFCKSTRFASGSENKTQRKDDLTICTTVESFQNILVTSRCTSKTKIRNKEDNLLIEKLNNLVDNCLNKCPETKFCPEVKQHFQNLTKLLENAIQIYQKSTGDELIFPYQSTTKRSKPITTPSTPVKMDSSELKNCTCPTNYQSEIFSKALIWSLAALNVFLLFVLCIIAVVKIVKVSAHKDKKEVVVYDDCQHASAVTFDYPEVVALRQRNDSTSEKENTGSAQQDNVAYDYAYDHVVGVPQQLPQSSAESAIYTSIQAAPNPFFVELNSKVQLRSNKR